MENLKNSSKIRVMGLMSGTSLDGLDICIAEVSNFQGKIQSELISFESMEYSADFKKYLLTLPNANTEKICEANFLIAREWSGMIDKFLSKYDHKPDLIASHGQTVWHSHGRSTLQIGEPSVLAYHFSLPCVADFRVMDVAAGGSGAPLVPIVDFQWFKKSDRSRLLLNIGGIANFTIIPKNCRSVDEVYALDTGPGNGLIDAAVALATHGEQKFDKDGEWAARGKVDKILLDELMAHEYFSRPLPKSTGKEIFGEGFVRKIIEKQAIKTKDEYKNLIATLTRFTAETIYLGYEQFFSEKYTLDEIVVSGGGAYNPVLMQHLTKLFTTADFVSGKKYGIHPDSKEAYAFAVLGALRIWEIPANVPNVTGAEKPVLLGKIVC